MILGDMDLKRETQRYVLALGFFDGVHKGHMELLKKTLTIAKQEDLIPAVMTFAEHPLNRIFPAYAPWLITGNQEKLDLIYQAGIGTVFLDEFTDELMQLSPEDFVIQILIKKYHVGHVVIGFNYTFGWQGSGTTQDLIKLGEKYHFGVTVVPPYIYEDTAVSSTKIREMISVGKVAEVPAYLGRFYQISGKVIHGKQLGRTFDFPTANLELSEKKILPESGVYFTRVEVEGKTFDGLTNLGFNPTFENHPYSIETYIYDFDNDIYEKNLTLTFFYKERGEIKFKSLDELIQRIREDVIQADRKYRQNRS